MVNNAITLFCLIFIIALIKIMQNIFNTAFNKSIKYLDDVRVKHGTAKGTHSLLPVVNTNTKHHFPFSSCKYKELPTRQPDLNAIDILVTLSKVAQKGTNIAIYNLQLKLYRVLLYWKTLSVENVLNIRFPFCCSHRNECNTQSHKYVVRNCFQEM